MANFQLFNSVFPSKLADMRFSAFSIILLVGNLLPIHLYAALSVDSKGGPSAFAELQILALPAALLTVEDPRNLPPGLREVGTPLGESEWTWRVEAQGLETGWELAKRWSKVPGIRIAEPDYLLPRASWQERFNDPLFLSQWYHASINTNSLFELSLGDSRVRIAVIDSAIEIEHPEFAGAVHAPVDIFDNDQDPSPNPGEDCYNGSQSELCDEHGTSVAGIAVARANNNEGIVGLCPQCSLIPIKLLGSTFSPLSGDIAAFEHAIDNGAWVINNSWGYKEEIPVTQSLRSVIVRAATEGRNGLGSVVVFASGNEDREIADFEVAAIPEVLCVSAIDNYGNPTPYTNTGASIDIAAPSATVSTSVNGGYTSRFGGTSAAAPVVAGVAGLILSYKPELRASEVRDLIVRSAKKDARVTYDENGHHYKFGFGFLDPEGIARELSPQPEILNVSQSSGGCAATTPSLLYWLGFVVAGIAFFRETSSVI